MRGLGQTASTVLPPITSSTPTTPSATTFAHDDAVTPATPASVAPVPTTSSGPSWLPESLRNVDWLKVGAWGAGLGVAAILLMKMFESPKKKAAAPSAATIVIPQSSSPVVIPQSAALAKEIRSWA